ncbi:MAG: oligosaccharide flippase family protein, partial [Rhodanobacteraceae bacterium]
MLRGGALMLAFVASLLYARVLGPHDYGLYAYVLAWSAVMTIPASLGLPQYLVREGSRYRHSHLWLLHWSDLQILLSGLAAGVLMGCAALIPTAAGARWLFVIASPLPLLTNLAATRQALIQSRGQIVRSQWAQMLLAPGLMLVGLLLIWFWHGSLSPTDLTVMLASTALAPLLINHWMLRSASGADDRQPAPVSLRPALAFMWLGMLYLINSRTDLIMLGALKGAHAAGVYAVASRASELTVFFLAASNAVIAPRISRLHHQGDNAVLQRLLTGASIRVALLTLPIVLIMIFLARPLLGLFYGPAFA